MFHSASADVLFQAIHLQNDFHFAIAIKNVITPFDVTVIVDLGGNLSILPQTQSVKHLKLEKKHD